MMLASPAGAFLHIRTTTLRLGFPPGKRNGRLTDGQNWIHTNKIPGAAEPHRQPCFSALPIVHIHYPHRRPAPQPTCFTHPIPRNKYLPPAWRCGLADSLGFGVTGIGPLRGSADSHKPSYIRTYTTHTHIRISSAYRILHRPEGTETTPSPELSKVLVPGVAVFQKRGELLD